MQSIIDTFHTFVANSGLSAEDQELLMSHFQAMKPADQYSFLTIALSDPTQLAIGVNFLKDFAGKNLNEKECEDYLLKVTA